MNRDIDAGGIVILVSVCLISTGHFIGGAMLLLFLAMGLFE